MTNCGPDRFCQTCCFSVVNHNLWCGCSKDNQCDTNVWHIAALWRLYASVSWVVIASGSDVSPVWHWAVTWTTVGLLSIYTERSSRDWHLISFHLVFITLYALNGFEEWYLSYHLYPSLDKEQFAIFYAWFKHGIHPYLNLNGLSSTVG